MTEATPIIREAHGAADLAEVRELFLEYARSLNFSLCFQGFDEELESLPGRYAPPRGRLLLAEVGGKYAGGVGLRPVDRPDACEMKRLYVRPDFRGLKLGRRLAEAVIGVAREIGYQEMVLDTIESMEEAGALYQSLGFREIAPYYDNPLEGVHYFGLDLLAPATSRPHR
ncbi:MAG: GNAT family N-acetyltransferase [Alphaproteobacteria bacterium]|nr:GNAT family N-acetyltransferase [Alphaproteobacteria bacterium]